MVNGDDLTWAGTDGCRDLTLCDEVMVMMHIDDRGEWWANHGIFMG